MGNCISIENTNNCVLDCRRRSRKEVIETVSMSANEVRNQLHVYHDPFASTTSQPKIPDGKVTASLGFSSQVVTEVQNRVGEDIVHMLLYPGMNSCVVFEGVEQAGLGRSYYIPNLESSGGADFSSLTSPASPQDVEQIDDYAKWRVVSTGIQLKLLNSVEEDDGWWEAFRVNEAIDHDHFRLTTGNNGTNRAIFGTLAPIGLNTNVLPFRTITNEPSYATGLLRDLHRVQFECHPSTDEHDFQVMADKQYLESQDYSYNGPTQEAQLSLDSPHCHDLIKQYIDFSHDMVYVRLHCRPRAAAGDVGSRFHINAVSNQEIVYDSANRLSRYMTKTANIGQAMPTHTQARQANGSSTEMQIS